MSGKVFRYFSCTCGNTYNKFVYRDMSGLTETHKSGVYSVNPDVKSRPETSICDKCGESVEASTDPHGLPPKFYFNFMEE